MNIVERLLMREEIDALELDLARAREVDDIGRASEISARIARLETNLSMPRRNRVQTPSQAPARQRAA